MNLNRGTLTHLLAIQVSILCSACSFHEGSQLLQEPDLTPPRFLEVSPTESPEVHLIFNETIKTECNMITLDSGESVLLEVFDSTTLALIPQSELIPGHLYKAALTVEDLSGNSCRFILPFWGWNPRLPGVLINEMNPKGSDSNPDCIELYFTKGGNTAGLCLYYGTRNYYDYRYVLPDLEVNDGDYLIIHCRRKFLDEEVSEYEDKAVSGGKLSSDDAWDLWLPEDQGLSGANGVLTIYNTPGGILQDGVVYTDRDPDPEDDYLGWTSRTFDPVADLYSEAGWNFSNENINPKEAVFSGESTATRSICRNSQSFDSDSKDDWHTVPTSQKSFGSINTDEVYSP